MTKKLEETLGLNPMPVIIDEEYEINKNKELDADVEEDLIIAKEHIINARDIASRAMQQMLDIADQSQDHKAYGVLNDLIKTYLATSMETINLQTKKQKLIKKDTTKQDESKNVTNNNLFVGSTEELLRMISNKNNET